MKRILATARDLARRLRRRQDGNVLIMFGLAAIPLVIAVGMGIDIGRAYAVKVRLGTALDDAGLAVASTMDPTIDLKTRLNTYFYGNFASNQLGVPTAVNMKNDPVKLNAIDVTGTATVPTTFMAVAGFGNITVGASAQVTKRSPNIDFYLLLDSSPSMAIGATQADINALMAATKTTQDSPNGCGFGCHETARTDSELSGNPLNASGVRMDNYELARSLNLTLRMDLVTKAAQDLMTTAQSTEKVNNAQYQMGIYTFDVGVKTIQTLTSNLGSAQTAAGTIQMLEVYSQNYLTSTNHNNDQDTNFEGALSTLNTTMPNPGNGSTLVGDKPQEVLFLVTDGVDDVNISGTRTYKINTATCATIKSRGIRIAVLYTVYLPLPTDSWYNSNISSFQPNIGTTLQGCASPGLYFAVQTGGDISGALSALFEQAVQSAYLSQ